VQFQLTGDDVDRAFEGDVLTTRMSNDAGTVNRGATFVDQGNGVGIFTWQTDNEDAGVYNPEFEVRDSHGLASRVNVRVTVIDINRPPVVRTPIADIQFNEDDPERQVAVLTQVFTDPDNDGLTYRLFLNPDTLLDGRIDNQNRVFIHPRPNKNGIVNAVVEADDGRGGIARDSVVVTIRSINDLPTTFALVSPRDSSRTLQTPNVRFTWRRSIDTVERSPIRYSLVLFFNGVRHYYPANDSTVTVPRAALVGLNPNVDNRIQWWVYANDGTDSVRSINTWNVFVPPVSVESEPLPLPTDVSLSPAYPNPFNDRVTIGYALPRVGMTILTIHDQQGRMVTTLINRSVEAGRYLAVWDGTNGVGAKVPSGLYFVRMVTPEGVRMERMVLLR